MSQTTGAPDLARQPVLISKSKFVGGLQCAKLLWHSINTPEQLPATDPATQAIFDQGHEVGAFAKKLYPGGLEIGEGVIHRSAVVQWTREALPFRKPLFEAALEHSGGYARADILNPVGTDEWEIVEVKSSTELKDVFLDDIAFQYFVFTGAGLKLRSCSVLHVNNTYVRNGAIDPSALFTKVDVTSDVLARLASVPVRLAQMLQVVALDASPAQKIGLHCDAPYKCALHDQCWSFLPDGNVLELYRGKKKGFDLIDRGVTRLADVPDDFDLTAVQKIQRKVASSGQAHIDRTAIQQFVDRLEYPLHFMDFESFMTAIPLFDGVRPYQQVPFQFSLHIVNAPGAEPIHHSFLAEGTCDPRRAFIDSLQTVLGSTGSVVVYNLAFERTRLRECCECFPEIGAWLRGVERRFVDLLVPFRGFAYYNPAQKGSASIKMVLPALGGADYEELEIGDGGTASREFVRVTFSDVPESERRNVRQNLESYCKLDTVGMVNIINALRRMTT